MSYMFNESTSLTSLNLFNCNNNNVNDLKYMFIECTSLNLFNFNNNNY